MRRPLHLMTNYLISTRESMPSEPTTRTTWRGAVGARTTHSDVGHTPPTLPESPTPTRTYRPPSRPRWHGRTCDRPTRQVSHTRHRPMPPTLVNRGHMLSARLDGDLTQLIPNASLTASPPTKAPTRARCGHRPTRTPMLNVHTFSPTQDSFPKTRLQ
jgi:hypothetical protein